MAPPADAGSPPAHHSTWLAFPGQGNAFMDYQLPRAAIDTFERVHGMPGFVPPKR